MVDMELCRKAMQAGLDIGKLKIEYESQIKKLTYAFPKESADRITAGLTFEKFIMNAVHKAGLEK